MKKPETSQASPLSDLDTTQYHWQSVLVYIATIVCLVELPLLVVFGRDMWDIVTAIVLTSFLGAESYFRFTRNQTLLGPLFAPILAVLIIGLLAVTYTFSLY